MRGMTASCHALERVNITLCLQASKAQKRLVARGVPLLIGALERVDAESARAD